MSSPLNDLKPEEITLLAAAFGIIIAESSSVNDASLLASFLSTVASNIALYLQRKTDDQTPPIPGQ